MKGRRRRANARCFSSRWAVLVVLPIGEKNVSGSKSSINLKIHFVVRAVQIPRSGKISAMGHTFVFPIAGILASGSICAAITTKLVVECPRNTDLKHSRIKRIPRNLESLSISEEVVVQVLILNENSHSFPLSGDEGIDIWVVTYFDLILIIEY